MKKHIITLVSVMLMALTFNQISYADTFDKNSKEEIYHPWYDYAEIPDRHLQMGLNKILGHEAFADILISDLENIKGDVNLSNLNIKYLDGLQYLKNANSIDLSGNKIVYLCENNFENLDALKKLNLSNNSIINISALKGLKNLEFLDISHQIHTIIRDEYTSLEYVDDNTMLNEIKDENNNIINISEKNVFLRDNYEKNISKINYNPNTRKLHWTYNAFDGSCYNPWQPIVIFNKDVTIGKAKAKFNGAVYMTLEHSYSPNNVQDNCIKNKANQLLDTLK